MLKAALLLTAAALLGAESDRKVDARLKEVARLQGVRGNQLLGYGIVVGLDGSGDKDQTKFTVQTLTNLMARQGITVLPSAVKVKNVAAVMVTAELPPFAKPGQRIDVTVSSTGDAKSLAGGTLLMSPLMGPDSQVYAVAQGAVLVGGFSAAAPGAAAAKNHPTAGRIPDGAVVEREVPGDWNARTTLRYSLQDEDFSTAVRVAHAVNEEMGEICARPTDPRTVEVGIPRAFMGKAVELAARLENLPVQMQPKSRVVVNEKTGTLIMGSEVKVGPVSIVQGSFSIVVSASTQPIPQLPQAPKAPGAVGSPGTEEKTKSVTVTPGVSVGRLAEMLNALGMVPRDMVAVIQAIKDAGALNAELRIL